jgi:hypothetical protein
MRLTPRNTQFYDMFTVAASNTLDAALVLKELMNAPPTGGRPWPDSCGIWSM